MRRTASIEVPEEILDSARLTAEELRVELELHLYDVGRLSLGKARELAGMSHWQFRQLLGSRRIPAHYGQAELDEDASTLRGLLGR